MSSLELNSSSTCLLASDHHLRSEMALGSYALLAHSLLLLAPACLFLARPPPAPPAVAPLIRSYGLLALSIHLVTLALAFPGSPLPSALLGRVSLGCAVYHVGPILRALGRLRSGDTATDLGGPMVHLLSHLAVLSGLLVETRRSGLS